MMIRRKQYNRHIPLPSEAFPKPLERTFPGFAGGYVSAVAREVVPPAASSNMMDVEVTNRSRLRRAPGVIAQLGFNDFKPEQMMLHAALENRSELVFFDPPFMGVKGGKGFTWYNVGLADRRITAANYGGTLIFCDGVKTYGRDAESPIVQILEGVPTGNAFASFAARLVVGGSLVDGRYEPLGVSWSAANSAYDDFEGTGSGFELLINDMTAGDRVISLNPLGLDFMAVFMRNSIWIGRRTGLVLRPIDFQPRVSAIGAINQQCVQTTRFGIVFLSDTGVYLFDGNVAQLISQDVNPDLLPLDRANPGHYSSVYDPETKKYHLLTPSGSWLYDLEYQRWERRSLVAYDGAVFAQQFNALTWGELTGQWGEQPGRWTDYMPEQGLNKVMFLGSMANETVYGEQTYDSLGNFGVNLDPRWEFPMQQGMQRNTLVTTQLLNLEYAKKGEICVYLPDNESHMQWVAAKSLPLVDRPKNVPLNFTWTGRGLGLELRKFSQNIEIVSAQVMTIPRGIKMEDYL